MDLKINIAEDAELRKYIKSLISGAVKNIVREEISDEVRKTLKTVVEKSLSDYLIKDVLKQVITSIVTEKFKSHAIGDGVTLDYWNKEVLGLKGLVEKELHDKVTKALAKFDIEQISTIVRKELVSQISEKLSK